jgi:hypothetical protein
MVGLFGRATLAVGPVGCSFAGPFIFGTAFEQGLPATYLFPIFVYARIVRAPPAIPPPCRSVNFYEPGHEL